MTSLETFIRVCRRYLIISDPTYIHIIFGTIFANRLDSCPVWLYLVAPPSSGKTEMLIPLYGASEIHWTDSLTKNTLISFYGEKKDASLIPKLDGKVLIIKDFTEMLKMRREVLQEILGQLRNAYDGKCSKTSGKGVTKSYNSKFGVIAAVTDEIDSHRTLLAALGERFITYRIPDVSRHEQAKRCLKAMQGHSLEERVRTLTTAAHKVLARRPKPARISESSMKEIIKIAQVVALGRTGVRRDRYTREPDIVRPEYAVRLAKQLGNLAVGIAMAREKPSVTKEEVRLVQHTAIHSLELKRIRILNILLKKYPDWVETTDISEPLCSSHETAHYHLDDLVLLDLAHRRNVIGKKGRPKHQWQLKQAIMLQRILEIVPK